MMNKSVISNLFIVVDAEFFVFENRNKKKINLSIGLFYENDVALLINFK